MGKYTSRILAEQRAIDPDDDGYMEQLLSAEAHFRTFSDGLDEVLPAHGYEGDISSIDDKCAFLRERFKSAGIPVPRSLRSWYEEGKRPERVTAFRLCMALRMTAKETDDFFCRVCLERSFDYHSVRELMLYYGIRHGYSYARVMELVKEGEAAIEENARKRDDRDNNRPTLYTSSIHQAVDSFHSDAQLICYIRENADGFLRNNVTAGRDIRALWKNIAADGLALEEDTLGSRFGVTEGRLALEKSRGLQISEYDIYLCMLGLDRETGRNLPSDRNIRPVIQVLHPVARDCFPDRDGLNKILHDTRESYERIRKMLILLCFYHSWANLAVVRGSYAVEERDCMRCEASIDHHLLRDGYAALYPGNPYDWLFLYADLQTEPLTAFREMIGELTALYEEDHGSA